MILLQEHWLGIVLAIALAIAVCSSLLLIEGGKLSPFTKRRFLTPTELEFLGRLEEALPHYRIHAQVAMGALLQVSSKQHSRKAVLVNRAKFSQKIVDFAIQSRTTGEVLVVVELDDHTHNSENDRKRDAMLHSAGYKTIRFHVRRKPDAAQIRLAIMQLINASQSADR